MIYSKYTKTWIKACDLCNVAIIDYENYHTWDVQFLKKYCIIEKKSHKKNNVGYCLNPRCHKFIGNI